MVDNGAHNRVLVAAFEADEVELDGQFFEGDGVDHTNSVGGLEFVFT